MALLMTCDACGREVPGDFNGSVRVRLGKVEYAFHLCEGHQEALFEHLLAVTGGDMKRITSNAGVRDERKPT